MLSVRFGQRSSFGFNNFFLPKTGKGLENAGQAIQSEDHPEERLAEAVKEKTEQFREGTEEFRENAKQQREQQEAQGNWNVKTLPIKIALNSPKTLINVIFSSLIWSNLANYIYRF